MSITMIDLVNYDLSVREIEPMMNNHNRLWLEQIPDTIPVIIYVYDIIAESIIFINQAISHILGYSAEEIKNQDLTCLIHKDDLSLVLNHRQKWHSLQDKQILEIEYRVFDLQGNIHWFKSQEVVLSRTSQGKVQQVAVTILDITEQKKLEIKLQKQLKFEQIISEIAKKIQQLLDLKEILETTVTEVKNFLQTERVIIYQLKSDWSGLVIVEAVEKPWMSLKGMTLVDEEFVNKFIPLYKQGRIQATADIYHDNLSECHVNWLSQLQVKANLVIPILNTDDLWGLLVVQHCSNPRPWETEEIEILQKLSIQVGIAIEQAELYHDLKLANQELELLACLDGLTNIANRRSFDRYLNQEWKRGAREQFPLSLILCDVDYFKNYNDIYGHQKGDNCLQKVARELTETLKRPADLVARYGGEEFAIILPNTDAMGAVQVAGEIRSRLRILKLPHISSKVGNYVTMSCGISSIIPSGNLSPKILIEKADRALYEAKKQGRDRIILAGE